MTGHEVWHVFVLAFTLFAVAGLVILLLAPLAFGSTPPGLRKSRPFLVALIAAAAVLLAVEWLGIHGRSL